jgi:type IV secretion system protein TrbG
MRTFTFLLATAAVALSAAPASADAPATSVKPVFSRSSAASAAKVRPKSPAAAVHPTQMQQSDELPVSAPLIELTPASELHPWWDTAVYRLATAPERVSDIALQPGETLIAVAAGDTARWVIGDTTSGSGATRRTHILVKPAASGLHTNLVITTDRRVYHLELASGERAMTSIAWTYPQDELLALHKQEAALAAAEPVAASVAVERLNFNYAIGGDAPAWRPIRAFDDGAQVFIEFPPALESSEAPPLFVIGSTGKAELVNYRKRGLYYVVDRLFDTAELRVGEKRQQVVRIIRSDGARQRKARGRVS